MLRRYEGEPGHTVVGDLRLLPQLFSPQLGNSRDVLVLLPQSYEGGTRRYPVLYMHDGQNLFDARTSYAGEWCVDESLAALALQGYEAIVVGIPNSGPDRLAEYSPYHDRHIGGGGNGRRYLDWLVQTLKPRIDGELRTLPDPRHTALIGSSMGGLISLYGFFRHPDVFGLCGAMSPSLWFARTSLFAYINRVPFPHGTVYLDVGTAEGPLTVADAREMHQLLLHKGYRADQNLFYVEDDAGHNEAAWGNRFPHILPLLLPRLTPPS